MLITSNLLKPRLAFYVACGASFLTVIGPVFFIGLGFFADHCQHVELNWYLRSGGLVVSIVIVAVVFQLPDPTPVQEDEPDLLSQSGLRPVTSERLMYQHRTFRLQLVGYSCLAIVGTLLASFGDWFYKHCPVP